MKNVQTIFLGLVIALGVIYVVYNETRIADLERDMDIEVEGSYANRLVLDHQQRIEYLENFVLSIKQMTCLKNFEPYGATEEECNENFDDLILKRLSSMFFLRHH